MGEYDVYLLSCTEDGSILHCRLDGDGQLRFREKRACSTPSYLIRAGGYAHVVVRKASAESPFSGLVSFPAEADGSLGPQAAPAVSTLGEGGCHLCEYRGKIFAANYFSGSVFRTPNLLDRHSGKGFDPDRQDGPHAHFIAPAPDGSCLLSTDLGLDTIFLYDENLRVLGRASAPAGSGPRHLAYSEDGKTVFCANELGCSVSAYRWEGGNLSLLCTEPDLPRVKPGDTAAAIRVKGNLVYVSNRGDDSISCFSWDGKALALRSVTPCGGVKPRDFTLAGDFLICAHEEGGTVCVFRVCGEKLTPTGSRMEVPSPYCAAAFPV